MLLINITGARARLGPLRRRIHSSLGVPLHCDRAGLSTCKYFHTLRGGSHQSPLSPPHHSTVTPCLVATNASRPRPNESLARVLKMPDCGNGKGNMSHLKPSGGDCLKHQINTSLYPVEQNDTTYKPASHLNLNLTELLPLIDCYRGFIHCARHCFASGAAAMTALASNACSRPVPAPASWPCRGSCVPAWPTVGLNLYLDKQGTCALGSPPCHPFEAWLLPSGISDVVSQPVGCPGGRGWPVGTA